MQICHNGDLVAEGTIRDYDPGKQADGEHTPNPERWRYPLPNKGQMLVDAKDVFLVDHGNFYNEAARCGLEYGKAFRQIEHCAIDKSSAAIR